MSVLHLIPVWFVLALLIPTVWAFAGAYRRAKVRRPATCPEIGENALIALDARDTALMHLAGNPGRKIASCSRWPERENCARTCLLRSGRQTA